MQASPAAALYYPEWEISAPRFLFEALMFWDRLAVIGPDEEHRPHGWHEDPEMREEIAALNERYVSVVVPTEEIKARAHERLVSILDQEAPDWCTPRFLGPKGGVTLASQKFLPETIELLRHRGWGRQGRLGARDINIVGEAAANVCMNALVEACSSADLPPLTADYADFASSCNLLLSDVAAREGIDPETRVPATDAAIVPEDDHQMLLARVELLTIDGEVTPKRLRKLAEARKDQELDALRVRFRDRVTQYLDALRTAPEHELKIRLDHLREQLRVDRRALSRELRRARIDWVLEKEGLVATLSLTASGIAAVLSSGALLAPGLVSALVAGFRGLRNSRRAQRAVLEKHWTSWLFVTR